LYMRHALQIPPADKEVCDKPSLQAEGEAQSRKVGAAMRALNIPVSQVKSSEPCRSRDTARLLDLGNVEITTDLNPLGSRKDAETIAGRKRLLAQQPAKGTNTVLVSHVHGSATLEDRMQLEIAEIIVFRPDDKGRTTPVARIRLEAWEDMVKAAKH
jgi:phosphohistidine phosphatase SixA